MSESKHLRVIHKGYEGFTGFLGRYEFVDGISIEKLTRNERDRMAAGHTYMEINEDGSEEPAGIAHRMISTRARPAEVETPLERRSEKDKRDETIRNILGAENRPDVKSRKQLEDIADKSGIAGLREIGDAWEVRERSIPALIEKILGAQELFLESRNLKIQRATGVKPEPQPASQPAPQPEPKPELQPEPKPELQPEPKPEPQPVSQPVPNAEEGGAGGQELDAVKKAAASGEMGPALSTKE